MSKLIAAINITLDGYCDHTAGIADEQLHDYYTAMLHTAGALLYGRTTYQLMEDAWPAMLVQPTGNSALDNFAAAIDKVPKIVFSRTLSSLNWASARLATASLEEEVMQLKQQPGLDCYVGSPSLISTLTESRLIDEYQLCVHPVILGKGLPLFRNQSERLVLKMLSYERFDSGAMVMRYVAA